MNRKVILKMAVSSTSDYTDLVKMYNDKVGDIVCWRNRNRICSSDCAAWFVNKGTIGVADKIECRVMPHRSDQEIAKVITKGQAEEKEIPDPPKPPPIKVIREGVGTRCNKAYELIKSKLSKE